MAMTAALCSQNAQLISSRATRTATCTRRRANAVSRICLGPAHAPRLALGMKSLKDDSILKCSLRGVPVQVQQRPLQQSRHQRGPCQVVSFTVEHSVLVQRPVEEVIECILDLPSAAQYAPGTADVELLTPGIPADQEGVTYKIKGFVQPLQPFYKDFKLNGYVYNKLLKFDREGSATGGVPTIVREMKTVQGTGVEVWSMVPQAGGTLLKYNYSSTGFQDEPEAQTTWEQSLLARFNIFKYFDDVFSGLFKALVVESLAARKEYIEKKAAASNIAA